MTPREEPRAPSLSSMRKPDGSMVSKPLEDLWPFLPRDEFLSNMVIPPVETETDVRILIAGLGAIGQRHARNLRALCGDGVELLAFRRRRLPHVVTESLERDDSRNVEAELGVTAFEDLDEALAAGPDARVRVHAFEPAPRDRPARGGGRVSPVHREAACRIRSTASTGCARRSASKGLVAAGRLPVALSPVRPMAARPDSGRDARPARSGRDRLRRISAGLASV